MGRKAEYDEQEKAQVATATQRARNKAMAALREAHAEEYQDLYETFAAEEGLRTRRARALEAIARDEAALAAKKAALLAG